MTLHLGWASYEAASFAAKHWHYSKKLPVGKMVRVGVWENGSFIGVVIFSRGASPHLATKYGLSQYESCELTRVALTDHEAPVSQIVAKAIQMLKANSPGMQLIISFADPLQGHAGTIYQAMNWIYTGTTEPSVSYRIPGTDKLLHNRQVSSSGRLWIFDRYERVPKPSELVRIDVPGKHRYLYPLNRKIRRQVTPLAQPYPTT